TGLGGRAGADRGRDDRGTRRVPLPRVRRDGRRQAGGARWSSTMRDRPGPSARWRMPAAIRASIGLHVVAALAVAAVAVERLVIGAWGAWSPAVLAASVGAIALNHAVLTLAGLCPRCSLLGGN